MKIRILGNSVRFRLTRTEVDTLCAKGYIENQTNFDTNVFIYAVRLSADSEKLTAQFKENRITLNLPLALGSSWNRKERIGFSETMDLGKYGNLSLLLEKDFTCLDERQEDQSDNYPNPKALL